MRTQVGKHASQRGVLLVSVAVALGLLPEWLPTKG